MGNLSDKEGSAKSRRTSRAADVAVEIEEIPLVNSNIYETIQPSMTDTHYTDTHYMECGLSSPVQSTSSIYKSFEELNAECNAQIVSASLMDQIKDNEGIRLLEDIQQGKITAENIPQFFETSSELEKNIAFLWSALRKRSDLLEVFLSIGAELNFCDRNGLSALHLAAFSGCLSSTSFLISKQMEVNMQPKYYTPLHCAAFGNSLEIAKILLDNGALIFIDTKNPSCKESLLHCAVRANSLDCVKLFIEKDADVNSLEPSGTNAIHLAAELGHANCLEALLNAPGADPNIRDRQVESTALHYAACEGNVECINLLLSKGADSNHKTNRGVTALHYAAYNSNLDCVRLLLEKGHADPKAESDECGTPLHAAVTESEHAFDILETLISWGANVNHQDRYGITALHLAAHFGYSQCLKALLHSPGAAPDIKLCTHLKESALHLAAAAGSIECVNLLLAIENADPKAKEFADWSPLHAAVGTGYWEHSLDILERLISWGANVNHQDDIRGLTALHVAALVVLPQCVEKLIYLGADVTIKTKKGITALNLITKYTPTAVAMITNKFDAAITLNRPQHIENKDVELKLNFCALLQFSHPHEISYLKTFADEGQTEILEHPLCTSFLYIKWEKIRKYYYSCWIFCFVFVSFLTLYVLAAVTQNCYNDSNDDNTTTQPQELCQKQSILGDLLRDNSFVMKMQNCYNCSKDDNTTTQAQELCQKQSIFVELLRNNSFVMKIQNCYNDSKDDNTTAQAQELCQKQSILGDMLRRNPFVMEMLWWVLVCITILEIFRKFCGMTGYSSIRQYVTQKETYLEWCVILSVLFIYDIHMKQTYTFHYPIGAFAVLVGWTNLMLMIGQLPVFDVYVAMYTTVLKEFSKLFVAYFCMLVGFTISFCVIFPLSPSFADPIMGFITVLVMMSGEQDLSLLINDPDGKYPSILLEISRKVTFVLFLVFVTIILINLLVGIAVNDIQGLKKTAEQSKLVQQTKLIYYMESILLNDKQSTWVNKVLHYIGLKSPQPFQEEVSVKPLNPDEKNLSRDILMAAYKVAKKHEHSGNTISPRCSEAINFTDNDKKNNNKTQEPVCLSKEAGISTVTPKIDDIAKRVEALTIEMQELRNELIQQQQQASKDINKILLVISNQQRNNFIK